MAAIDTTVLVDKSRQIVESLWGSFRINEAGGEKPDTADDEFYWTKLLVRLL